MLLKSESAIVVSSCQKRMESMPRQLYRTACLHTSTLSPLPLSFDPIRSHLTAEFDERKLARGVNSRVQHRRNI